MIWSGICVWSLLGVSLLMCNCNMLLRRIFCLGLVAAMVMVSIAEFWTMANTKKFFEDNGSDNDNLPFSGNTALRDSRIGLNAVIWMMEIYLLGTACADAWIGEYENVATGQADIT